MYAKFMNKAQDAVNAYIRRMVRIQKQGRATSNDFLLECPKCDGQMEYRGEWKCLTRKCGFVMPPGFSPPGPEKFKELMRLKKDIEWLKANKNLLASI